jgi:hypothetical protein
LAIERDDVMGDGQYLLRYVKKRAMGHCEPMIANENMRTFARFKEVIDLIDLV